MWGDWKCVEGCCEVVMVLNCDSDGLLLEREMLLVVKIVEIWGVGVVFWKINILYVSSCYLGKDY